MGITTNVRWQTWKLEEYGDRRKESKNEGDGTLAALEDRVKPFILLFSMIQGILQRLLLNGWARRLGSGSSWEQTVTALLVTGSMPAPCWTPAEVEHNVEQICNVPWIVYFHNTWKNCAALPQGIHSSFITQYWFVRPAYDLHFCLTLFLLSWYFPFIIIKLFFHQTVTVCVIQKWENSLTWNLIMFLCALDIIFQQHQHFQQCILTPMHDGFIGVTQTIRYQNYLYLGNEVTTTFGAVSGK